MPTKPTKAQLKKYTEESKFIFSGKVAKLRAATMPELPMDNTMIIQVEQVVKAPDIFMALAGKQVTVRFKKLPNLKSGSPITVYCKGWIFGKSLAVDAVGYSSEKYTNEMVSEIRLARTGVKDKVLKQRLDSASMGVVGTVVKVEKAGDETQTTHFSEHDPNWHEATIGVDEVVKGKKDTKEVKVLFPQSDDIRWHKINKYKEGQKGIWLLQKGKKQDKEGINPKAFAAIPPQKDVMTTLHPTDFLSINDLGKIKSLLKK